MNDSFLLRQEQCPLCAKEGNDRKGNNLAVYSDGHSFCFGSHGLVVSGNKIIQFKNKDLPEATKNDAVLPTDCDTTYPNYCLEWVGQYELDRNDLLGNNVLWSDSYKRLIFPVYGDESRGLIAWQGRYFGDDPTKAKWFGRGDLKNTFHILGNSDIVVLVEDIVSAIKVAKAGFSSMSLFGCVVGVERFKRLYKLLDKSSRVVVWLDENKRKEAVFEAKLGRLYGMNCTTVFSKRDPKDENYESIKDLLALSR